MRILTQKQIKRAISNVNASLAIEGLKTSRTTMIHGQKILQGEIDIDDAIKITTKNILAKKRQLIKAWLFQEYIFQDIYSFAGKIREENITKGNTQFCDSRFIHEQLNAVLEKLKNDKFLQDRSPVDFSRDLSTYISELNMIHPFREGNGRALREFIRCLALKCRYELNWDAVDPKILLQAFINSKDDITELVDYILMCIG